MVTMMAALAAVMMADAVSASPLVLSTESSGFLYGIGYREQELQQAKSQVFSSDNPSGVSYASYAGYTNIFIEGSELATDPDANFIVMRSEEFDGQKFIAPQLTLDDSFQSNTAAGLLSYRLPSIEKIFGLPQQAFESFSTLTFTVSIRAMKGTEIEMLECKHSSNCKVIYRRDSTPKIYYLSPSVVYKDALTQYHFNSRHTPNLVKGLLSDELPMINAKIGLTKIDFEGWMDNTETISSWKNEGIRGQVSEDNAIAKDNTINIQWETGASDVSYSQSKTCSFDGTDCYTARVLPVMEEVSSSSGYLAGGQKITIKGNGFNYGTVNTLIDGVACSEVSKTDTEFVCTTGAASTVSDTTTDKAGQQGTKSRLWTGQNHKLPDTLTSVTPTNSTLMTNTEFQKHIGDSISQDQRGWFIPPETTDYRFYIACDDLCKLKLGDQNPNEYVSEDLTTVLYHGSYISAYRDYWRRLYRPDYYDNNQRYMSDWISLTAGNKYYFEHLYAEGGGGDFSTLSVEIKKSSTQNHPNAMKEIQKITMHTSNPSWETTIVKIVGPTGSKFRTRITDPTTGDVTESDTFEDNSSGSRFRHYARGYFSRRGMDISVSRADTEENGVTVHTYTIKVNKLIASDSYSAFTIQKAGTGATITVTTPQDDASLKSTPPLSGTYKVKCFGPDGKEGLTDAISVGSSISTVISQIEKQAECPLYDRWDIFNDGTCSQNKDCKSWWIRFRDVAADMPQFEIVDVDLFEEGTTTKPIITATTLHQYGDNLMYEPIPFEFLKTYETKPQVLMTVGDLPAACSNMNCDYTYVEDVGDITSFNYNTGTRTLTITGTSLPAQDTIEEITFARSPCVISASSDTSITCVTDSSNTVQAGTHEPVVRTSMGQVKVTASSLVVAGTYTAIAPKTGLNALGNDVLTITGTNFPQDLKFQTPTVQFSLKAGQSSTSADSNVACTVLTSTSSQLTCKTSKFNIANLGKIYEPQIVVSGQTLTNSNTEEVTLSSTINRIDQVDPDNASPVLDTQLTVTLNSAFPADKIVKENFAVRLTETADATNFKDLRVFEVDTTAKTMKVMFNGATSGDYEWAISHTELGEIEVASSYSTFKVESKVTSFTPTTGSIYGGTKITITGTNFGTIITDNPVQLRMGIVNVDCFVLATSQTEITCRIDDSDFALKKIEDALGAESSFTCDLIVFLKTSEEADYTDRTFTFTTPTPEVTSITSEITNSLVEVTVVGTGFGSSTSTTELYAAEQQVSTVSVSASEAKFRVSDSDGIKKLSDLSNLKLYFSSGIPKGNSIVKTGVTQVPSFESVTPATGSTGGSVIIAKIVGIGKDDIVTDLIKNSDGSNLCTQVDVVDYGYVRCYTKSGEIDGSAGLKFGEFWVSTSDTECGATTSVTTNCGYSQSTIIPTVSAVSKGSVANTIKIDGTDFFASDYTANVVYGGVESSSVSINSATEVVATFDKGVPIVQSQDKPILKFESVASTTFNSRLLPSTVHFAVNNDNQLTNTYAVSAEPSATECSFKGGCLFDIPSVGLASTLVNLQANNYIEVCSKKCEISSADSTSTNTKCTLPQISTLYSDRELKITQESNDLKGFKIFGTGANDDANAVAFDDDLTVGFESASGQCNIGVEFKEFHVGLISEVKYLYVSIPVKSDVADKVTFQGSMDGTEYTDIFTVDDQVREGWNYKTYDNPNDYLQYRYYRFSGDNAQACRFGEIKFKGVETINNNDEQYQCPVNVVINNEIAKTYDSQVTFKATLTPTLTSMDPKYGTVAGGTTLTLTGTGFSSTTSDNTVIIDGVACAVTASTDTTITCTTGSRTGTPEASLEINVNNKGRVATQGLRFIYGRYWSDINTWGGGFPPIEGDSLTIQKGVNMIVDIDNSPQMQALFVFGSLIFLPHPSDPTHHRTFDARYIFVNGGKMEVGTEEAPYTSKITITLHGQIEDPYLPIYGNKVLGVRHATLDMHGVKREPVWTTMKETADVGATQITLSEQVDWAAGDVIAIATTSFDPRGSEKRTITSVDKTDVNSPIIKFAEPLINKHFAQIQTFGSDTIDTRAEVGLLTRNVVFRGDPETSLKNTYGATIFIHSAGDDSVVARLSYIELTDVGQKSQLGRYAVHFHMIGAIHKSYVKGLGLHQGFNRAFTIHGNSHLRILNNFVYDVFGHTVFIEDAAETKNYIEGNLIMQTKRSMSLLNTDQTPGCFWITNPDNQFINNRAAGSDRYGYWFDLQEKPTGPSADPNYCPIKDKLGEFRGNHAHSVGRYGLRIFHGHSPRKFPCKGISFDYKKPEDPYHKNPIVTANYVDFTGWKCNRNGAITGDVGDVRLINFKVADNILAGLEYEKVIDVKDNKAQIRDALIIGKSANTEAALEGASPHGIITPRSEFFSINGAKFYNFDFNSASGIGSCSHCFHPAATDSGARTVTTRDLFFDTTVPRKLRYQYPNNGIILDKDGTLTGKGPNTYASAYFEHLEVPECTTDKDVFDGVVCDNTVQIRGLTWKSLSPSGRFTGQKMAVVLYDDDVLPDDYDELETYLKDKTKYSNLIWQKGSKWAAGFVTGHKYKAHWGAVGLDWEKMRVVLSERFTNTDKPIFMVHNFTDQRHRIKVFHDGKQVENNTLPFEWDPNGNYDVGVNLIINGSMKDPTAELLAEDTEDDEPEKPASEQGNRFVKYIMSPKDKNENNKWEDREMKFEGTRCVWNCNPPAPPPKEVVKVDKYWSDDTIWDELDSVNAAELAAKQAKNPGKVIVGQSKGKPGNGDDLTIPQGWNLILDVPETPILKMIKVHGSLTFNDNESQPDTNLRCKILFNQGGLIQIGTDEKPFSQNAKITLYGRRNQEPIALSNDYEGGNKIIANLGTIKFYGKSRPKKMARLLVEGNKGDTKLKVEAGLDWVAGDELAFAPTSYKPDAASYKKIKSYDIETGDLVLTSGLDFYHFGAAESTSEKYGLDMRGEVLLLSRNIKIQGTTEDNWGAQILNGDASEFIGEEEFKRTGQLIMKNVEMNRCSQTDTAGCLRFESAKGMPSIVKGCSLHKGEYHAVTIVKSEYIVFEDNVIMNFKPIGIRLDFASFVRVANNFIGHLEERPTFKGGMTLDKRGGIIHCNHEATPQVCTDNSYLDNIVAGAFYGGFILPGHDCGDYENVINKNNVAHSVVGIGHGVFPDPQKADAHAVCYEVSQLSAYKNTMEGVWTAFTSQQIIVSKITTVDNIKGNAIQGSIRTLLKDSVIFGEAPESKDCPSGGGFCSKKSKFGLQASIQNKKPPIITSKPAYPHSKPKLEPHENFVAEFKNIKFKQFYTISEVTNQRMRIFELNKDSPDFIPAQMAEDIEFTDVEDGTLAYFFTPPQGWANIADCGDFPCTGPLNTIISVQKATFEGTVKPLISLPSFFLIPLNRQVGDILKTSCLEKLDYNGYICADFHKLGQLVFESLDEDKMDRSMQPVYVSQNGQDVRNKLNSFMDKCWDGFYTCQKRLSRFPALIETEDAFTLLKFTGTPAQNMRFKLKTIRGGATVVSINYPNANTFGVYDTEGNHIPQNDFDWKTDEAVPISKTKCGENQYIPVKTILNFYITDECTLFIRPRNVIMAKVRMQWDFDSFFESGGTTTFADRLAASLGIHASTVKVVGVYEGSVICDYEIAPEEDPAKTEEQKLAELAAISDTQTRLFTDPTSLDLGGPLLDASVGGTGQETSILAGGVVQIDYTPFSNTLSCSRCIKGNHVYVYNYDIVKPDDFVEQDFSVAPEETDDTTTEETDNSTPEDETPAPEPTPEPYTYVDLADDESAKGWCCQKAGDIGLQCGSRNIGGQNRQLVPNSWTPTSNKFASDDLAMIACPQKTSNCGTRNNTIAKNSNTPVTLTGKGLSKSDTCSWIVKVECGLPIVKVLSAADSITETNTRLTYSEWQPSILSEYGKDQWAPHANTQIPKVFKQYDETIGTIPKVEYEQVKYSLDDLETQIKKYNSLVSSYKSKVKKFESDVDQYNYFVDLISVQYRDWETYTWFDRWFSGVDDVVTYKLPSKPTKPSEPAPSTYPDRNQFKYSQGGAGSPQAGEISLKTADIGKSKYFGVMGQTIEAGDYGFTVDGDSGSKCKERFVALNVHVHDDSGVSATDEIQIEVSVQKKITAKTLEFSTLPRAPNASFKGDPKAKFEADQATGASYIFASLSMILLTIMAYV